MTGAGKKGKKRPRHADDATRDLKQLAPPTSTGPGDGAAPRGDPLLLERVEVEMDLRKDPQPSRDAVTPRDLRQLVLWTVPTPVPLVEAPKIFFVRNKSAVRHVLVIYVQGWTYDLMYTGGCGTDASPSLLTPSSSSVQGSSSSGNTEQCRLAHAKAMLRRRMAAHLLRPLRAARCWARQPSTSFAGAEGGCDPVLLPPQPPTAPVGAVYAAPLVAPTRPFALERELFWRSSPSTQAQGSGAKAAGSPSSGVSERFKAAMEIHRLRSPSSSSPSGAGKENEEVPGEGTGSVCQQPAQKAEGGGEEEEEKLAQEQAVWDDWKRLMRHALYLPDHRDSLDALGFILDPPPLPPPPPPATTTTPHTLSPNPSSSSDSTTRGSTSGSLALTPPTAAAEEDMDGQAPRGGWRLFPVSRPDDCASLPRVVALDCEMVLVEGYESALARATLLDARSGDILMDRLVVPALPVVNYLTRYSGIDEEMLQDVTYTLLDCQNELCTYIDSNTFLVGHSLENDLKACRMLPNCRILDSAWLFPHPAGLPIKNALRFLVQRYFNKKIQQGSHDSTEDAWCSAQLVRLKLLRGPGFGMPIRRSVLCDIAAATAERDGDEDEESVGTKQRSNPDSPADGETLARKRFAPEVLPPAPASACAGGNGTGVQHTSSAVSSRSSYGSTFPTPRASASAASSSSRRWWAQLQLYDTPEAMRELVPLGGSGLGAINMITVRNDGDAVRKAVRAMQKSALRSLTLPLLPPATAVPPTSEPSTPHEPYYFFYLRLSDNCNPFGEPPAESEATEATAPHAPSAIPGEKEEEEEAEERNRVGMGDEGAEARLLRCLQAYEEAWRAEIDAVNQHVMRLVEAAPDGTIVTVVTGGGGAGDDTAFHAKGGAPPPAGTPLKNRGAVFTFVKDHSAPGPDSVAPPCGSYAAAVLQAEEDARRSPMATVLNPPVCRAQ